jgi:trk system potassium uptake protein TrkH
VASIISTTGYSTTNFDEWPTLSKTIIILLMFTGACAGSTAGGLKLSRINILFKSAIKKIKGMIFPRKVESIYIDGKPVTDEAIDSVHGYIFIYALVLIGCALLISVDGHDLVTNFTASLAVYTLFFSTFSIAEAYLLLFFIISLLMWFCGQNPST